MPGFQYSINSHTYAQYFAAVREKNGIAIACF
jgi:hypothetical protein